MQTRLAPLVFPLLCLGVGTFTLAANSRTRTIALANQPVTVQELKCEYMADPLGIDTLRPRLSWKLISNQRGERQTAYQVLVATSEAKLKRNKGDLWDSRRILSDQTSQVVYVGKPMQSRLSCYWKVRVWDKDGNPSDYSAPARWEMGLLNKSDWHGQWIGYTPPTTNTEKPISLNGAYWIWYPEGDPTTSVPIEERFFRRQITLPNNNKIKSARLRIAADNLATIFVNGEEVGQSHDSWTKIEVFDVASHLKPGANLLAVRVKNEGTAAGLAARLEVSFESGDPTITLTDKNWKTSKSISDGWQTDTTYNDAAWVDAKEVTKVGGKPWGQVPDTRTAPPAPLLRHTFAVQGRLKRARAYICGLGYFELHLNGQKVGDHMLDPGYTRYDRRDLYVTYDVTPYLQAGSNAVGIILGTGPYDDNVPAAWDFEKAPWRDRPKALMELRLEYENGRVTTLTTDNTWKASTGPITFDNIYAGENYDARLEKSGWDTPRYNDAGWETARLVAAPKGILAAEQMPPIKVGQILKPAKLSEPKPGVFLYDMGQNFAGLPQLSVEGTAGTKVVMACGEKLHKDGTLEQGNIAGFVKGHDPSMQFQTDIYTLKGTGREVWSPHFTYHGFQYVEVTGFPGKPTLDNLRGLVMHSAMQPVGHFECSNPLLNAIQHNTIWSYLSNFQGIPTDCPHREKNGWTGDAQLAAEQGMYNFDSAANYVKWLNDLKDEQQPGGALPGIVPTGGWGYQWGNGPAWDSAYPLICWYLYQYYGDTRIFQVHYEHLRRYVDYLTSRAQDGIVSIGLGDWVPPGPTAPVAVTDTGYYYRDALIVAQAASLLGNGADARKYTQLAASIKRAFNAKFFDPKTSSYADGSQTALSCALYQGLVEPQNKEAVLKNLVAAVDKHDGHIFTGILGAKYVMNTLLENGRPDVAYTIATQKTAPGWGNWIERGATTLWEDWGGGSSLNHIMFGDISAWFYKALAGINGDPAAPGFNHFFIKPQVLGDLTWARGEYDSIHGKIVSDWKLQDGQFKLDVTVPVNTTAMVVIPGTDATKIMESSLPLQQASGVKLLRTDNNSTTLAVSSGTYHFTVPFVRVTQSRSARVMK
ncbi:MAG: family 78 glycoside hydrolase catalytic domain [Abitibacteriaceae bacterium]|nr:family 78 glycoside hydrolase catalytic domain [Abditibacteriaceae bacterium]MBV9867367.1 family 78 glycoside hydrolase catalytic domain [Abditibacteriaceae bacterium]